MDREPFGPWRPDQDPVTIDGRGVDRLGDQIVEMMKRARTDAERGASGAKEGVGLAAERPLRTPEMGGANRGGGLTAPLNRLRPVQLRLLGQRFPIYSALAALCGRGARIRMAGAIPKASAHASKHVLNVRPRRRVSTWPIA